MNMTNHIVENVMMANYHAHIEQGFTLLNDYQKYNITSVFVEDIFDIDHLLISRLAKAVINKVGLKEVLDSKTPCKNIGWRCGYNPAQNAVYFTLPYPYKGTNGITFDVEIKLESTGYQVTVSKEI